MSNKSANEPSDLQITLITTGLVLLGIVSVGGLILNAVNPNFHILSRKNTEKQQITESTANEATNEQYWDGIEEQGQKAAENIAKEIEKIAKTASESAKQATESGTNTPSTAEVENLGPSCSSCEN